MLLTDAAWGIPVPRTPVWVMRQAGRYLPEFQQVRADHDFFTVCRTPELACEVTLQPIRRYAGLLDAAIIFSDILVIPQALGMSVSMLPEKGPHFPSPISSDHDAQVLLDRHCDVAAELSYVYEAISLTRSRLDPDIPLLGFAGAPWTLFSYMLGGGGRSSFATPKRWLYSKPDLSHALFAKLAETIAEHLTLQIKAGAQAVQLFDSWASELSPALYQEYGVPYLRQIASSVHASLSRLSIPQAPLILFAKGATSSLHLLTDIGFDVLGLDWTISPAEARKIVDNSPNGPNITLQGNLDPSLLLCPPDVIEQRTKDMFDPEKQGHVPADRVIANLGHGITPDVSPEHLCVFLEAVHRYGQKSTVA